ncbi:MAG: cobalt-precorrin-6A reductase [Steroidobacteraceae bacterium]
MRRHILILGGTSEARQLAQQLAPRTDIAVTLSLAGRTGAPVAHSVPVRSGGFGGIAGLAQYLRDAAVFALIDATHPYAAAMSAHAVSAAESCGTPMMTLRRPPWAAVAGDRWTEIRDVPEAIRWLGAEPRRVFLALGRQHIAPFGSAPQHYYLIRSVDPVEPPLPVPQARYIEERGPFAEADERRLLAEHAIDAVVSKNSGGAATYGKISAARSLGIPVLLLRRPPDAGSRGVAEVGQVIAWLDRLLGLDAQAPGLSGHVPGTEFDRGV